MLRLLLGAVATLPAIAFLIIVHGTILAGLFAIRLVRRKCHRANRRRQNRKQDLRISLHRLNFVRDIVWALAKKTKTARQKNSGRRGTPLLLLRQLQNRRKTCESVLARDSSQHAERFLAVLS